MHSSLILAVDDDPVNLHIIEATFEDAGYDLRLAHSGASALELLERENLAVDLVILDRMMPDTDGLEVLRRIKATPRLARTPVVMQTAAAGPEQVEEGLQAGAHSAWERYLELDSERVFDPNGRGIALTRALSFRNLRFEGRGNVVVISVTPAPKLAA